MTEYQLSFKGDQDTSCNFDPAHPLSIVILFDIELLDLFAFEKDMH